MKKKLYLDKNFSILIYVLLFLCSFMFILCKNGKNPTAPANVESSDPGPYNTFEFEVNNFHVTIDGKGAISDGYLTGLPNKDLLLLFRGGLWLGASTVNGPQANIIWSGTGQYSNFSAIWPEEMKGVYHLNPTILSLNNVDLPDGLGFPVDSQGNIIHYGDAMCMSVLKAATVDEAILSRPITDMSVTQALYGYRRQDLANTIFLRYSIKVTDNSAISEMYSGFYMDTDLSENNNLNSTGYDPSRALSYTYSPRDTADTFVTGFVFLESPLENGLEIPASSHRIMRKNDYYDPDFGEVDFNTQQQILYALQGLSNTGLPMVDSTTGEESLYAFTGDPVLGTGWLDVEVDVRSMLNYGPFSVSTDEDKVITIVIIAESGENLAAALQALKNKVDIIRNEPNLWQF